MNYRVVAFVVLLLVSLPAGVVGAGSGGAAGVAETAATVDTTASTGEPTATLADLGPEDAVSTSHGIESSSAATATGGSEDVLHRTTVLRHLPDEPGEFETEMTFRVPDPVTELEIELDAAATVESTDGFEATDDGTYRWTETTDEPTVRFTMPANRTGDVDRHVSASAAGDVGNASSPTTASAPTSPNLSASTARPAHSSGGYSFIDTGEWGIVQVPGVSISLRQTESVGIEKTVTVDGPGATGGNIAFFGPVEEHERTADGETIRLVVPEAADLQERPEDVLDVLAGASERLDVGASPDEVFVVAAPTDVDWGPRGIQYGEADAWVVADAPLSEAHNVWLHEYVHVRQGYTHPSVGTAPETTWLVEAQADYYAGLLALEKGLIDFDEFSQYLADGEGSPYADGVLADPKTWQDDRTDYVKGRLVYGELDRQLRLATDGDRTLEDVFRQLNAKDDQITEADVLGLFEDAGGENGTEIREIAERYTQTTATPESWSGSDHETAFEQPVAEFAYGFDSAAFTVDGESWPVWKAERDRTDGTTAGDEDSDTDADVTAIPTGQSVTVPATVANVGDREGTYDATLQVDGKTVDYAQARLETGAETVETLSWTPSEPGMYKLRVGDDRLTVFVRGSASVTVTDLTVDPAEVDPGESVTATATVKATGERPGAAVLEFRTPHHTVENPVALPAGETTTIEREFQFDASGQYEVSVGGQSTTVSVDRKPVAELEEVPGFTASAVIAALLATLVIGAAARRD